MTRNDKLYDRVDDLIINFKELLKKELTKESNDCPSTYFSRKEDLFRYGPKAVGKYWQDQEVALIERHEKQIMSIANKLKDQSLLKLNSLADEYVENTMQLQNRFKGEGKALARKYLEILKMI